MTNINVLPYISGTITIATNGDFCDSIQFNDATGVPIDITGISFSSMMRPNVNSSDVLLQMSTSTGLIVVDGPLGQISFNVPRDKPAAGPSYCTSELPVGSAVMDLIASDGSGRIKNLCQVSNAIAVNVVRSVSR